jgi:hypothetical protein
MQQGGGYTPAMFIKLTRSGERTYAQLVESFRDEHGKPRQRTVATLGRIDERGGQVDSLPDGLLRAKGRPVATGGDLQVRFESARAWGMSGPSMRCGMSWASMPWGRCSGAPASPPPSSRRSG